MPAAIISITPSTPWKCIRRKVLCRKYPRLTRAVYPDTFGREASQTRTQIVGEKEANWSGTSQMTNICRTERVDLPATFEGPPTYEIPESRKALLTGELEKRKTGGELISFGFSASNACSGWIPLHYRSASAIQPSPRISGRSPQAM
jgi:hypothetical protein